MNRSEFAKWLQGHMAVFPVVKTHYDTLDGNQKKAMETAWYGVVRNTEARDAADATNQMIADPKLQPSGGAKEDRVARHITKIRDMAEDCRQRRLYGQWTGNDGEQRFTCLRCKDTAWISIHVTEMGAGGVGMTTCPYCERGRMMFQKRAPKHQRHESERHLAWVESSLVPAKTQQGRTSQEMRVERDRVRRAIAALRKSSSREPGEDPGEKGEGFRHISEEIPF